MKNCLLLLLAISACLTSCKKSESSSPVAITPCNPTLITYETIGGQQAGLSMKYTRDAAGNISKIETIDSTHVVFTDAYFNFSGSNPGMEIKTEAATNTSPAKTTTTTFTWSGNRLVKSVQKSSQDSSLFTSYYKYDSSGNLICLVNKSSTYYVIFGNDSTVFGGYSGGRPGTKAFYSIFNSSHPGVLALESTTFYTYDANLNCIKKEIVFPSQPANRITTYTATFGSIKGIGTGPVYAPNDRDANFATLTNSYRWFDCQFQPLATPTLLNSISNTNIQTNASGFVTLYTVNNTQYDCSGNNSTGSYIQKVDY